MHPGTILGSCNERFPHSKPATKTKAAKSSEGKAMQCAALTQGKAFTGKIWKKVKGALHIPVSLADGCSSLVLLGRMVLQGSLLFVGSAFQNKFTTVPETKLHPFTLHFAAQNRRKTCWRNSRAAQIFCNPSPNVSPLRASVQPRAQMTKAEEEEVTVGPSWWCHLLLCAPEHMDQPLSSSAQEKQMQTYALKDRRETPNEKDRMSVKLCNYQQVNYSYRDSSWHTAPGTATAHESEQKGIFNC